VALDRLLTDLLGPDLPVAVEAYDGTRVGPPEPSATVVIRSPDALRRIVTAPGELGFARAFVAGDIDVEGDIFAALELRDRLPTIRLGPAQLVAAARLVGGNLRPLPAPPEEARLHGRRHTRERDAAAIAHHYDVGNRFYELVLGPSMTYSCAVFEDEATSLTEAQTAKYELVCRKLGLRPGMRLLDVGGGWGGMVLHAVRHHGVEAVAVTLSRSQQELGAKRLADAGVSDRATVRLVDYRDVDDGPYDAISSIGMFEHVGRPGAVGYFRKMHSLLRPGGRLLNHAITRPLPTRRPGIARRGFIDRYVFPDGELMDPGTTIIMAQVAGLEVGHVENLREHYARTLRHWVANLEANWDEAVAEAGRNRTRLWRLYMAGSAVNFEANRLQIHQVLAMRPNENGGGFGTARPAWDRESLLPRP
jgi:cyclopropane-fatty-acyl-phospholipid synthase